MAVVNADYATQKKLSVGSTITVAKTSFKVVGIASAGSNASDVFIPLARAQALASLKGKVNTIYVAADSASNISGVAKEISGMLPKATVTTSSSLASEVTGSLSSAASLANNLGKWLAIAVLIAAFLLASLLTSGAVARRVREFGTLKALGWRSRRIVGQVMGESIAIGIIGGVVGVALGLAGAALVARLAPPLSASVGQTTGSATPGGARTFGGGASVAAPALPGPRDRAGSPGPPRRDAQRGGSPQRAGHHRRGGPRGGPGHRGRPHRRRLRRLARGPAASCGGTVRVE